MTNSDQDEHLTPEEAFKKIRELQEELDNEDKNADDQDEP